MGHGEVTPGVLGRAGTPSPLLPCCPKMQALSCQCWIWPERWGKRTGQLRKGA